ncbi:MAG: STAS domain-containing protein [Bacteroidota bacterium]
MQCIKTSLRKKILKISFQGDLEARNLEEVQRKILNNINKSPEKVVVELDKYDKIDFSFIQLLLALKKHLEIKGLVSEFNLRFSEEDTAMLSRLNIINLLQTKSENNESVNC